MLPRGVSVTLVEPKGPVNVGHVARLVKNFGVEKLYLVNPKFDVSVAAMYASHAADVLDTAVVTSFQKVREQNEMLVATTAVRARKKSNLIRRTVSPGAVRALLSSAKTSSLVFGRDSTGLTNEEIVMCDATTTIETSSGYRSLNLGNAVAILLYLVYISGGGKRAAQSRKAREVFARNLIDLGAVSKMPEHKVRPLFDAGKRVAAASGLSDSQLNLLSGVLRKAVERIDSLQDRDSKA